MYRWIVLLHVVSAFVFFMAHGVSIGVALRLRHEPQPERLRPLLALSESASNVSNSALILLLITGVAGGFVGKWWRMGWIWVALALLIITSGAMFQIGSLYFNALRKAAGNPYMEDGKEMPALSPNPTEIATLLASSRPTVLAAIGLSSFVIIIILMVIKPF